MFEQDYEIQAWKKDHKNGEGFYWIAACKDALDAIRLADGYAELFKVKAQVITFDHPKDLILYETVYNHGSYVDKVAELQKRLSLKRGKNNENEI